MLTAIQTKLLSRFTYDFIDQYKNQIGTITWPDFAVANNARLKELVPKSLNTNLEIKLRDQSYLIEFEYLNRSFANNIRFILKEGATTLATAEAIQKKWSRPEIRITSPFEGLIISKSGFISANYKVQKDGSIIGSIFSKPGFTLKHEFFIDLPETIEEPIQCFFFFLMMNHAYR